MPSAPNGPEHPPTAATRRRAHGRAGEADLNPAQRAAVQYIDGPLLVLAGAGSGKTRVITRKIAYLIGTAGLSPDRIDEVTQTAAEDMARRLAREEGLFAGISSGGAVWAALQISAQVRDAVIVYINCDRGDRYLSTGVFPNA